MNSIINNNVQASDVVYNNILPLCGIQNYNTGIELPHQEKPSLLTPLIINQHSLTQKDRYKRKKYMSLEEIQNALEKRRISNRISAKKSRERKKQFIAELQTAIDALKQQKLAQETKIKELTQEYIHLKDYVDRLC